MATHTAMAQGSNASMRSSLERGIGILHYVSQKQHDWHGQIRTRFTDFQVHEISKDGEVIHLHDFQTNARDTTGAPPARPLVVQPSQSRAVPTTEADSIGATAANTPEIQPPINSEQPGDENTTAVSTADQAILTDLLGQGPAEELINLHSNVSKDPKSDPSSVIIASISDKAQRSRVHLEIRRIFDGKIETITDGDGSIKATAVGRSSKGWHNRSRNGRARNGQHNPGQDREAKFLHFTLYKENRDTIEAISYIARALKLNPSFFGTAGTKDRRAVTTQRVSMRRQNPQTLVFLNNNRTSGVKIGDFKFENYPIGLGHHGGNEFVIVVKNCHFSGTKDLTFDQTLDIAKSTVNSALEQVVKNGFINYYGTQRFGTHQIGTQEVGMKILKEDFEGAVRALLSFNPDLLNSPNPSSLPFAAREDAARARACSIFLSTSDAQEALKCLPRRCHAESSLIRHLGKQPKDYIGALLSINRSMRTMYVHAYQSLVWNFAASERWARFGSKVIKGDLVLVESDISTPLDNPQSGNDDEEERIHLAEIEPRIEDMPGLKVHALTEEEANGGRYSIFDIVLPSPGWDVVYPDNEISKFYVDFMAKEENGGLDPHDMLRRQRDFSLPGSYRKLMGKFIGVPSASIQAYSDDTEQLVPTDLDLIQSRKAKEATAHNAAQRAAIPALSAWHDFAENAQERDRREYQSRVERRKAEGSSEAPEIRVRDTWIQTSLDGSNKRVKVSQHTDDLKENDNAAPPTLGTEMQIDTSPRHEESSTRKKMNDQSGTTGGTPPMSQGPRESGPSVVATLTAQTGEEGAVSPEKRPEGRTSKAAMVEAGDDYTENETEQPTDNNTTCVLNKAKSNNATSGIELATDSEKPADATASVQSAAQIIEPPATVVAAKKIAVILRFALDTSQYATIVLREIQGAYPTSEGTATSHYSSPSANGDLANSS
ncbi:pseudouridine synthase [Durotheca rogersii]|uniref:pseudouridine synthase n=1 Tax=Durotheca rogersii TaxID=419775 RepID=UPI002220DAFF|nr:pseudouridine synthase [Durotheca rogersii]KAI5867973.1 pseudouridine synthase [Durotheca rogersii]